VVRRNVAVILAVTPGKPLPYVQRRSFVGEGQCRGEFLERSRTRERSEGIEGRMAEPYLMIGMRRI
jgi:hypothetical protein